MTEEKKEQTNKARELGIAIIGSGRIGTLRASLAAVHPSVRFLAVSDMDLSRARTLGDKVKAHFVSNNNLEVISRPEVNAVIVSTSEHEHTLPVLQALKSRKAVLVEKPIALSVEDANKMVAAVQGAGVELRVGYSQRFKRGYLLAKEQIIQGRLGQILGGTARVYNTRAQAFQILKRSPNATPVLDVLTYYVDLICWFLKGNAPVEVVARAQKGVFRAAGYEADDLTLAILTFADGAVVSLAVDYAFPERYPSLGQSPRLEILGTGGVILLDEERKDQILYTDLGLPHAYIPGHNLNMAFLGSTSTGDWAVGDFWGPLADETRAWLNHLSTGRACALATLEEAYTTLEVTLAIEKAVRTMERVKLPLGG